MDSHAGYPSAGQDLNKPKQQTNNKQTTNNKEREMERITLAELCEIERLEAEAYQESEENLFALVANEDKPEEEEEENEAFMEFDSFDSMKYDEEDNDWMSSYYE